MPRTLSLDAFIRHWVTHQIEVIVRRTRFRLRKAEERAHILRGLLKALDAIDEVIALIRRSDTVEIARHGLMDLLEIDEIQANAILEMQLRRSAAWSARRSSRSATSSRRRSTSTTRSSPVRQRGIVSEELAAIVEKFGDDRQTKLIPYEGDMSIEDLIAEEDIVVTVTHAGGYIKRTKTDDYRAQKRGGEACAARRVKEDDIVDHFFVSTTHHWLLFFTNKGRVYRVKGYELRHRPGRAPPSTSRTCSPSSRTRRSPRSLAIRNYEAVPYLVLATKAGLVKKTPLKDYDSPVPAV
ncbi:DNA gyrase subunit A [Streptomyces purpurascens]